MVSSFSPPNAYDAYLASLKPTAWWKLGDPVGSLKAADSSGNGYDGTVNGGVTFGETGPLSGTPADTCAVFDGSTGYIDAGNPINITGALSIVFWIRTSSASNQVVVGNDYEAGYYVNIPTGYFSVYLDNNNALRDTSSTLDDGAWHMGVATVNGSGVGILYIDGSNAFSANAVVPADSTYDVNIGRNPRGAGNFNGDIAQVAIFDYALSATPIAELWKRRNTSSIAIPSSTALDNPGAYSF